MDASSLEVMLTSQSNIELDSAKNQKKTNDYGIAYFNLLILQGKNGPYKLTFSATGASDKSSNAFNLINPINNVTFYRNINQTIQVINYKYFFLILLFYLIKT